MDKSRSIAPAALIAALLISRAQANARALTFEERVKAQEAIERVYYAHQTGATAPFEQAVPRTVLEQKVRKYLKQSVALEQIWHTPVTGEMLQAELERMVRGTRLPDRLREIDEALGNDPFVVQECFARATLVDRLARNWFAFDYAIHSDARREAESLRNELISGRRDPFENHPRRSVVELVEQRDGDQAASGDTEAGAASRKTVLPTREYSAERARTPQRIGESGALSDNRESFEFRVLLDEGPDSLKVATFVVPKVSWDEWWKRNEAALDERRAVPVASERGTLPTTMLNGRRSQPFVAAGGNNGAVSTGVGDIWDNGILDDVPAPRTNHTAVWTGSRMVVWGGSSGTSSSVGFKSGGIYDPATDSWTNMASDGAPAARIRHVAIWTGSRMLVWGGQSSGSYFNTGGSYDPAADVWTPMSTSGAPAGRSAASAVWTGSALVVWGGDAGTTYLDSGGVFSPSTDTWTPTSTNNAPAGRMEHTAVWTGSRMVVWGGRQSSGGSVFNSGGIYDPTTDSWAPTSTTAAPATRYLHTAIWTGNQMVVWGGNQNEGSPLNNGGAYDPATDTWTATATTGAPIGRMRHSAVWTGSRMLVWGGLNSADDLIYLNSGGAYDPVTNTWTSTSTAGAAQTRASHTSVWTGSRMVVWGGNISSGSFNTGGAYDPASNAWTPTAMGAAATAGGPAVWTGNRMATWGGSGTGGLYDPATDSWTPISTIGSPGARTGHSAVWTGNRMIVFGGYFLDSGGTRFVLRSGGAYDPVTDLWAALPFSPAPARYFHTAVWTGSKMAVWGGTDAGFGCLGNGIVFNPATNAWTSISASGAPAGCDGHTAVSTGDRMMVWGGRGPGDPGSEVNSGGAYDPSSDTWTQISSSGAPAARRGHTAVWTGSLMVVWGGADPVTSVNSGGTYDPTTDAWVATSTVGAPASRASHAAVWTGSRMVVWGGINNTGGVYDPAGDAWTPTSLVNAPAAGSNTAVWTGSSMIVWGGYTSRGRYIPSCLSWFSDQDEDGFGDPTASLTVCDGSTPGGYVLDQTDCAPSADTTWTVPSVATNMSFESKTTMHWGAPAGAGGGTISYDVLRGNVATSFVTPHCAASDIPETMADDSGVPAADAGYYYLVRAKNVCGGNLGTMSNGAQRVGGVCP